MIVRWMARIIYHIDARYVGTAETAWRLLEFPVNGTSRAVVRL